LEKLQDYVHQELRDLEQIARNCLVAEEDGIDNDVECLFDESQHLNSYGFRSQLPLELPMAVATTPPAACTGANATPEKLPACQAAYTKAFLDLMTHPVSLDRLVAERWIIDKSQGRCRFDVLDLGCLTNNEVRAWQSKVGKRLTLVAESDRGKLSQLNLDIDPAIGAIWSTAAEEKAIADALSASSTLTVGALQ
jgi:hypothetical protein